MVVKPSNETRATFAEFESRVILDGSQTHPYVAVAEYEFESRVILDGSQTVGQPSDA